MKRKEHSKIVVLADLGNLRAFRLSPASTTVSLHTGPVKIEELVLPREEWDRDRPSRFPQGRSVREAIPMSSGESHNKSNENKRRRLNLLAIEIVHLLDREEYHLWCLAAPPTINKRLLRLLPSGTLNSLETNIEADLTHITLEELEDRFLKASSDL